MKPNKQEEWEDTLEKIWARAHIPAYALDAKDAIAGLFRTQLALARKEERERLMGEIMAYAVKNTIPDETGNILRWWPDGLNEFIYALLKTNQE